MLLIHFAISSITAFHSSPIRAQTMEFRIRKLEELNEQTLAHLGVIHRFMATYMPPHHNQGGAPGVEGTGGSLEALRHLDVEPMRPRRVSERSEACLSEAESHSQLPSLPTVRRKKLLRAMTDAAYLSMPVIGNAAASVPQHHHHNHHRVEQQSSSLDTGDEATGAGTGGTLRLGVEVVAESRENLSRNDSSVSGELATLQDESKETTSHDESDVSKAVGEVRIFFFFL